MSDLVPKEKLRQVYADILRGRSDFEDEVYGKIFIKHLTVWDTEVLDERREEHFVEATQKGLPSNEEKLQILLDEGTWTKEKERKQEEFKDFISRMNETKKKMLLKSEKDALQIQIEESEEELDKIISEKTQLIGLTSEIYADKRINDYYIFLTLYSDRECENNLFNEEEFDELNDLELSRLVTVYNLVSSQFAEKNMKRLALSNFFLNNFHLCKDNPMIFFGKPVVDLTYHQADLFAYGRYYKHMLSDMKHPPSAEVMQDPDRLLELYEIEKKQEENNDGKDTTGVASTVVGATKEDMEALGMTKDPLDSSTVDLNEEIRKKGGTLSMEDMIKLHGV